MDQQKIGRFIAACRKEKGYTQATLAQMLGITDRAISKWENARSMPDVSIMMDLCEILEINVNELLSGERIEEMKEYKERAEENLVELTKQEELRNKKLLSLEMVIGYVSSISFIMMIFTASYAKISPIWKAANIVVASVIFAVGMVHCLRIEQEAGYYECPNCGERYVPSMKEVIFAPHIFRSRKLRCPSCGKKGYHKKVLTK